MRFEADDGCTFEFYSLSESFCECGQSTTAECHRSYTLSIELQQRQGWFRYIFVTREWRIECKPTTTVQCFTRGSDFESTVSHVVRTLELCLLALGTVLRIYIFYIVHVKTNNKSCSEIRNTFVNTFFRIRFICKQIRWVLEVSVEINSVGFIHNLFTTFFFVVSTIERIHPNWHSTFINKGLVITHE